MLGLYQHFAVYSVGVVNFFIFVSATSVRRITNRGEEAYERESRGR